MPKMPSRSPLRPSTSPIVVCEGYEDERFLQVTLLPHYPTIAAYAANGKDAVAALTAVLKPATAIVDRDFTQTPEAATATLLTRKAYTCWPRHDMQGYLLYADWLMMFVELAANTPIRVRSHAPASPEEIEQQIVTLATTFVADHAGRATLHWLKHQAETIGISLAPENGYRGGGSADDFATWIDYLQREVHRIQTERSALSDGLTWQMVEDYLMQQFEGYERVSQTLSSVRIHFSGKRLLQALAQHWQLRTKSAQGKKPWEVLQDYLIEQVEAYSAALTSPLHDDPRLGDVGLLALKITDHFLP